jgi:hypothetical protein
MGPGLGGQTKSVFWRRSTTFVCVCMSGLHFHGV